MILCALCWLASLWTNVTSVESTPLLRNLFGAPGVSPHALEDLWVLHQGLLPHRLCHHPPWWGWRHDRLRSGHESCLDRASTHSSCPWLPFSSDSGIETLGRNVEWTRGARLGVFGRQLWLFICHPSRGLETPTNFLFQLLPSWGLEIENNELILCQNRECEGYGWRLRST